MGVLHIDEAFAQRNAHGREDDGNRDRTDAEQLCVAQKMFLSAALTDRRRRALHGGCVCARKLAALTVMIVVRGMDFQLGAKVARGLGFGGHVADRDLVRGFGRRRCDPRRLGRRDFDAREGGKHFAAQSRGGLGDTLIGAFGPLHEALQARLGGLETIIRAFGEFVESAFQLGQGLLDHGHPAIDTVEGLGRALAQLRMGQGQAVDNLGKLLCLAPLLGDGGQ